METLFIGFVMVANVVVCFYGALTIYQIVKNEIAIIKEKRK